MIHMQTPSVFESFNARNLAPMQVAKSFIPPKAFDELIQRSHSLIIGPRGSGKTTLLKMLQISALNAWQHPKANEYRNRVDFTGVFIAADVSWGAQIDALGWGKLSTEVQNLFSKAAFTTHVLLAFAEGIRERITPTVTTNFNDRILVFSKAQEANLVEQLASAWDLNPIMPNIINLKLSLRKRLLDISELVSRYIIYNVPLSIDSFAESRYLFMDFLPLVSYGIEAFNSISGRHDDKWALLFDELEIAPKSIRQSLVTAIRSSDERLLFKLSISPYSEDINIFENSIGAMSGQDFLPIRLWYSSKEEGYDFCSALLGKMLSDYECNDTTPVDVLGDSELDYNATGDAIGSYKPGSKKYKHFKKLASIDSSFNGYLIKNNIDINSIYQLNEAERASAIRKITTLVSLRLAFRRDSHSENTNQIMRSRKNPTLYTGASSIFAIVEGNPRCFIGIMTNLLRQYSDSKKCVDKPIQSREVTKAINRFRAMLRTISTNNHPNTSRGLLSLLDKIGEYFHNKVVVDDFTPEPPITFTVDSNIDPLLYDAIGKALNAGALIYIPDNEDEIVFSSLKGKRFRLSYLLAPYYKLPLTLGRSISLSKILNAPKVQSDQTSLF